MDIKCMGSDCTTEILPETAEEAFARGWRQTDNYNVSPKLELVWICSDCVRRLISILTMQMREAEYNTRETHNIRTHDQWANHNQRLEDLRQCYEEVEHTIRLSYGEALGRLKSPEAKRAEKAEKGDANVCE